MSAPPKGVAAGDFNGDGLVDVVVVSVSGNGTGAIAVRLRQPDGSYSAGTLSNASASLSSVAVGDFNSDQKLDLAVTDSAANSVSVMLGAGDGTFTLAATYPTGISPRQVVLRDVDNDNKPELLVANSGTHTVSLFAINADGSLTAKGNIEAGVSQVYGIALADFDHNGKIDLAVAGWENEYSIIRGNGDGTFQLPMRYVLVGTANPRSIAAGDLDADGNPDLVIASSEVTVMLGRGDMSFQPPSLYAVPGGASSVALADFNGDHNLDIAATAGVSDSVAVLLNKGTGSFAAAATYAAGGVPDAITIADLDKNGVPDVLVVNSIGSTVQMLYGNSGGTLSAGFSTYFASNGTVGSSIEAAVGDFNEDGLPDAAVLDGGNRVSVLANKGGYRFTLKQVIPVTDYQNTLLAGDVNNDGHLDLVAAGKSTVVVMYGNGDGTFQPTIGSSLDPAAEAVNISHRLALADLNGDELPELIVTNVGSTFNDIHVFSNLRGVGPIGGTLMTVGSGPAGVVTGHFNRDSLLDIAVATDKGFTVVYGNGTTTVGTGVQYATTSPLNFPAAIATADLNGDGYADIVVSGGFPVGSEFMEVFLGEADGTFVSAGTLPLSGHHGGLIAKDLNADGVPDVAVVDGNNIDVFYNDGSGQLTQEATYFGGWSPTSLFAVDLTQGGVPDLLFGSSNDLVTAIANAGGTRVLSTSSLNPSVYGQSVALKARLSPALSHLTPTGTIEFSETHNHLATLSVDSAEWTTDSMNAGTHVIEMQYSGDDAFYPRTFPSVLQDVRQASTLTTAFPDTNKFVQGHQLRIVVSVAPEFAGQPTGTVTLLDGENSIATQQLDDHAGATFETSGLSSGPHELTVNYSGDSNFKTSASPRISIAVLAPTTVAVTALTPSVSFGTAVTFEAAVSSPGGIPTGSVSFFDNGSPLGDATLNAQGKATLTVTLAGGSHPVTVKFAERPYFAESVSPATIQVVTPAVSGLTATSTVASIGGGYPFTLSAKVTTIASVTPTGSIVFSSGQTVLGTATLDSAGNATLATTPQLPSGANAIIAEYSGDSNYAHNQSTPVQVTVTPDFTATASATSQTVYAGQSASFAVALTGFAGFSGPLTMQCTGLPALANCAFNPATLTLSGTSPTSVTVTISTTGQTVAATRQVRDVTGHSRLTLLATCSFGVFGFVCFGLYGKNKGALSCILLAVLCLGSLSGCGGGGGSTTPVTPPKPSTPPGTNQLVVVISGTQSGTAVTHQVQFTLTVK